ncbi:DgyrCDS7252 [Dimorphilus gyrociliatus]|uniref:DgyrCDS7252 n=1 Tax=Dimorphilus gyrociliatus TaxID=2664684 RepID=A0A7I8VQP6_9ANNE|nr:DgyrCDS7252 [Dimorphilus gyrociliatus]
MGENIEFLDMIAMAEDKFQKEGFSEGFSTGEHRGFGDAFLLGVKQASSCAAEIGFYRGFCLECRKRLSNHNMSDTKLKICQDILDTLEPIDLSNCDFDNMLESLQTCQAKFKRLCALMKISTQSSRNSMNADMSF